MTKMIKTYRGGGQSKKIASSMSKTFKPLIATSLALTLGVSVAVATDPSITLNDNTDYDYYKTPSIGDTADTSTVSWTKGENGLIYLTSPTIDSGNSPIKYMEIKFDRSPSSILWTGSGGTVTMFAGGADGTEFTFDSNGNGIQLGDGSGELKLQLAPNPSVALRTYTANLTFSNTSSGPAFKGNLRIVGGYQNTNIPSNPHTMYNISFSGDMQGDINQALKLSEGVIGYTPFGTLTFHNASNLTGNLNDEIGGITLTMGSGRITGNVRVFSNDGGVTTYLNLYRSTGDDIKIGLDANTDLIGGNLNLSGNGRNKLVLGYKDGVTGSKVISFNPNATQSDGSTKRITLTNGDFTFYNMKQLNFVDSSDSKQTFTLQDGTINSATFSFSREVLELDNNSTIMKGNLTANNGKSIRFSFIDDGESEAIPENQLKTFVVDGAISATGGGLSFFYNDRTNSFEAKLTANDGLTQSGGYIGRNDAFFESGTFTSDKSNTDLLTIQGKSIGVSHLRFNDNVSVSKGIGAIGGNGTELFFYKGVSISAFDNSTKITTDTSSEGSAIFINGGGKNIITIENTDSANLTNTITGNIKAINGENRIIFNSTNSINQINGDITISGNGITKITSLASLNITGSIIADTGNTDTKNNVVIETQSLSITQDIKTTGGYGTGNKITINGNTHNTISGQLLAGGSNAINSNEIILTNANASLEIAGGISTEGYGRSGYMNENKIILQNGGNLTTTTISTINNVRVQNIITLGGEGNILVSGNITKYERESNKNIFNLTGNNATLTLRGTTNQITSISGYVAPTPPAGESRVTSGVSTLILDGANATTLNSGVSATIDNAIDTGKLAINFNGDTNNIAKLTLKAGGNALEDITLGSNSNTTSTNNTLELSQGQTSIAQNVAIDANQALTFDLKDSTTLAFNGGLTTAGTATFNLGSSSATTTTTTISGEIENSGNNVFNVKSTTTTLKYGDSGLSFSSGTNTINFENTSGATLNWQNSEGNNEAITTSGGATAINFTNSGTIAGGVSTSGGNTQINLSANTTATINNISTNSSGVTTINFGTDSGTYGIIGTLSTSGAGQNIIDLSNNSATISNNLSFTGSSVSGSGGNIIKIGDGKTLTLQDTNNDATTLTTQGGATYLNFAGTSNLSGNITTTAGSTTFNLGDGSNLANTDSTTATITGTITNTDGTNQASDPYNGGTNTFNINSATTNLQYGSGLTFANGINIINFANTSGATLNWKNSDGTTTQAIATSGGATTINFTNSGTISGGVGTSGGSTTIAISNGRIATISGNLSTTEGSTNINFIGASGTLVSNISTTAGNTTFNLGDDSNLANTDSTTATITGTITNTDATPYNGGINIFNINAKTATLKNGASGLVFANGLNIINFTNTSINGATLNWKDSSNNTQAINTTGGNNTEINFTNNGTISGGVSTSGGNTEINIENSKIANISTLSTSTNGATFINFKGNTGTLVGDISTSGGTTTLELTDKKVATITGSMTTSGGDTEISFAGDSKLSVSNGISTTNSGTTTLNIADEAIATINGNITTGTTRFGARGTTPATNVTFKSTEGKTSTLILQGSTNQITTLTMGEGENILALAERGSEGQKARKKRSAVIDNVVKASTGSLKLVSQISSDKADTFIIDGATNKARDIGVDTNTPLYHIGLVLANGTNLIKEDSPVLVATVKNGIGIEFEKTSKFIDGFLIKEADFVTTTTNKDGSTNESGDYTSYLVGSIVTDGIVMAEQAVTATAFTLNYDLYMANLNSLNKRMGELRENAHSQGVWARVFNGALSNDFGLGSKSNYTTIQAGYDYAFGFEGANNYLGVALSYALSTSTTSSKAVDSMGEVRGIDSIYSNAVEVALYNSYVSDRGWYNDSIAKFSYLMSSFEIANSSSNTTTSNDTSNFALTLSDEVGYVFKLGESKEWSITPQVEATFGYFNQSDFKQTLADNSDFLNSSADSVLTLRTRVGSAFGYDFKKFTQKDTFNASLYVGAFYEYDYVSGGSITMSTDQMSGVENILSDISSDGRVVVNVGTNMSIKDNTRIYFDFEKSFAGKINTDYQVNVGVRYSFGESDGYSPILEKADYKAPLKIEGEEKEGEESEEDRENGEKIEGGESKEDTQSKESKEVGKTADKAQEGTKNAQESKTK